MAKLVCLSEMGRIAAGQHWGRKPAVRYHNEKIKKRPFRPSAAAQAS
jgi:hypothetical protein